MTTESDRSLRDDVYDRALARWEWEGGHTAREEEKRIPDPRKEKQPDSTVALQSH
ncbi:MAG: hypothetical protein WA975_19505 [Mesorhizobium sp.]